MLNYDQSNVHLYYKDRLSHFQFLFLAAMPLALPRILG
jgi:hypothetical protein